MSVPVSHPLRRLRPFGCPGLDDSPGQAPLTPPSPLKVSNPLYPGGGRGARSAPLSAPTRPPSPIFAGNVNISSLRSKTNKWNAPLSLRYGALSRAQRLALRGRKLRLRGASDARCVGAPCSPPANTARQMATSQIRQPAPLRRNGQSSRSASGAQARAFTRSGERALAALDTKPSRTTGRQEPWVALARRSQAR